MTARAVGSVSNARSRCSNVTYSCCRVVASASARLKVFSSSFVIIVLFHRTQERELISLSQACDFVYLHFSDFKSKDAGETDAFPVYVEHESNGIVFTVIKYSLQDEDDEFHRGEIVVMQKDLVERWSLQPCLTLGLFYDRATVFDLFLRHTATLTAFLRYLKRSLRSSAYLCGLFVETAFNAENAEIRRGPQRLAEVHYINLEVTVAVTLKGEL